MKFQELQIKLSKASKDELRKALGYDVYSKSFVKAYNAIINAKNLSEFLKKGYFDWLYNSKSLILKLAQILGVDLDSELKEAETYNAELRKYEDMYIYIGTNFKRTTQPIFALALLQDTRYVEIPDKSVFCFKRLDEQLKIAGDIVRDSYKKEPTLRIFGNVTGYKLHMLGKTTFLTQTASLWIKKSTNKWLRLDFKEWNMGKFNYEQRQKLNSINERLYELECQVVPRAKQINLSAKDIKEVCDHDDCEI